jgi:hypothetical protein
MTTFIDPAIARDRHVVHNGDPKQRLHVDIVWLGLERIPEEDHKVDPAFPR